MKKNTLLLLNDDFIVSLDKVDVMIEGLTLLSGITWRIKRGENWAVMGGNGAGKSTLLKLIRGELWPAQSSRGKRIYNLDGIPTESAIGIKNRIPLVSSELQDTYHRHQWNMSGRDVVQTGFFDTAWLHEKPAGERVSAAEDIIRELKLDRLCGKNFLEMSQGEARKILLARALVTRPALLLLDEPCDGLDAPSRKKLLHMIEKITESGTPILYAGHRTEEFIPSISHVLVMDSGKIIKQGEKDKVLSGELMPVKTLRRAACEKLKSFKGGAKKGRLLIKIKNADVFIGGKAVLKNISWTMRRGENWAFAGRNGAGKSTLLKLIAGDLHPALGGEISRFGRKNAGSIWDLKKRIGIVTPELQRDYAYDIKGIDAVLSGFFSSIGLYDEITSSQKNAARFWLDYFELGYLSEKKLSEMSYGEQRRILIARTMVNSPEILILDEPCSGLDSAARAGFLSFIDQAARSGVALIMATHHLDEIPPSVTHMLVIDEGKIIRQCPVS